MPMEIQRRRAYREDAERNESDGDEEIDPNAHAKLVDGINNLTGSHFIREVTRTEPALKRSEFGLAKTQNDKVRLGDLTKFFTKNKQHTEVVKQLDKIKTRSALQTPLEKPAADRIERKAGYERVQTELDQWTPVVTASQVAPQVIYPLQYGSAAVHNAPPKKLSEYRVKTKLMEAMEELDKEYDGPEENGADSCSDDEQEQYGLTVDEMREQQRERARQKLRESYESAKGRRMNKIKSKKYHRLLKKDKLKDQIKKFEEMKEKNPEEALRQLDRIEKERFQERVTLRHKNTGTWAKNLQVRAKYDTEVRRELAEQLAIGRELTARRLQQDESSSESEGEPDQPMGAKGEANPWTKRAGAHEQTVANENKMTSGYRKYWEERNLVEKIKKQLANAGETPNGTHRNGEQGEDDSDEEAAESEKAVAIGKSVPKQQEKRSKLKKSKVVMASGSWDVEDVHEEEQKEPVAKKKAKTKSKEPAASVEEMFQEAEELIQDVLENKLDRLQRIANRKAFSQPKANRKVQSTKHPSSDLSFKKRPTLADADEQMNETMDAGAEADKSTTASLKAAFTRDTNVTNAASTASATPAGKAPTEINLKQVVQMKPKHLLTALPTTIVSGELSEDEGEDDAHRLTIAEAFEDDDIVADFEREKQDERRKDLPQEVDTELPGWGHWAGPGVKKRVPRQTGRQIFKPPAELPRRDDNRDQVIINEDALRTEQLGKHLVSELPFPFVTVKDYEASLRAPLGRTFIPQTAHATMVEPRIVTKQGAVIAPMKKEMLLRNPERLLRVGKRQQNEAVNRYTDAVKKSKNGAI
uniref:U3 small nucleolar RNA-associated protein 14 homolog A n=1 Tax=Anopheles dirus TaxID=7168 RepID=A0A182N6D0_9DIPT